MHDPPGAPTIPPMTLGSSTERSDDAVVVARRPIVDGERRLVGFELVYHPRAPLEGLLPGSGGGVVAVHELLRSHRVDLDDVVGDKLAFCHADRDLIAGDSPLMLVPRRTAIVVRDAVPDAELRLGCAQRRREGYTIALDGMAGLTWSEDTVQLLEVVDIVMLDLAAPRDEVAELVRRCSALDVRMLARGCETEDDLAWAAAAGFELFLGRAVQSPAHTGDSAIAPSALSQLQLSVELLSADLELDRIEEILRREPGLVVAVLEEAAAGRARGTRAPVRSVREALVVMGSLRLQRWVAMTVLSRHGQVDTDALAIGLMRARMCELLAPERRIDPAFAFTAGLLSTLDLLLGVDLTDLERQLAVGDALAAAAFRGEATAGELVTDVARYQRAVEAGRSPGDELEGLTPIAAVAFPWAASLVNAVAGVG